MISYYYMGINCLSSCYSEANYFSERYLKKKKIIFSIHFLLLSKQQEQGRSLFQLKGESSYFTDLGRIGTRTCSTLEQQHESTSIGNTKSNLPNNLSKTLPDWNLVEQTPKFSILVLSSPQKYDSDLMPPKKCNFSKNQELQFFDLRKNSRLFQEQL